MWWSRPFPARFPDQSVPGEWWCALLPSLEWARLQYREISAGIRPAPLDSSDCRSFSVGYPHRESVGRPQKIETGGWSDKSFPLGLGRLHVPFLVRHKKCADLKGWCPYQIHQNTDQYPPIRIGSSDRQGCLFFGTLSSWQYGILGFDNSYPNSVVRAVHQGKFPPHSKQISNKWSDSFPEPDPPVPGWGKYMACLFFEYHRSQKDMGDPNCKTPSGSAQLCPHLRHNCQLKGTALRHRPLSAHLGLPLFPAFRRSGKTGSLYIRYGPGSGLFLIFGRTFGSVPAVIVSLSVYSCPCRFGQQ